MGRLYPAIEGRGVGLSRHGSAPNPGGIPVPANDNIKPYTIGVGDFPPLPIPANDNRRPGRGMYIPSPGKAIISHVQGMIIDSVGIVPGFLNPVGAPQMGYIIKPGGRYSYCPQPNGFGGPFSCSQVYFPGGSYVGGWLNTNACLDLQALPGGNDGSPDPGSAYNQGVWRYSNIARTRYSHLFSIRQGQRAWIQPEVISPIVTAGNLAPAAGPRIPAPPPKGTKEKKMIVTGRVAQVINFFSELADYGDCMYSGLSAQRRREVMSATRGQARMVDKLHAVYDHWDELQWDKITTCLVENHYEDKLYGKIGKIVGRANRKRGNIGGLTVGPAL